MLNNVVFGETFEVKVIRRIENSAYEYENVEVGTFNAAIVGTKETRNYRITSGVNGNSDSLFIKCSNLPIEVKVGDYVEILGEQKLVNSIGYFFEQINVVNAKLFSNEYLQSKCPKGLNIG